MKRWMILAALKRLVLALLIILFTFSGTAYAGGVTARVKSATCDELKFKFRLENTTTKARAFTVVLWNRAGDVILKLKDKVPAHGWARGVVKPNWRWHKFYAVEIFRTWNWKPDSLEWRQSHWLAGASARLDDC